MSARRAAQITAHYGALSQTFVADAIAAADAHGWESWLATMERSNQRLFGYPPAERTRVCDAPSPVRRAGELARGRSSSVACADALTPWLAGVEPEVLHGHFGWTAALASRLQRNLGVPLVVTFHATDVTVWPHTRRLGRRNSYDDLFGALAHAFVVSEYIERVLRDLGYAGSVELLPAGVELDRFPFEPAAHPGHVAPRVLFVGRVVRRKGLDVLIRALAELGREVPDASLEVIGDGPDLAFCEATAAQLGLGGRVRFLGAQAQPEVLAAMRRAHLVVVPSRVMPDGEVEGSPVVMKEALASGLPVIATASGGSPEVLPPRFRHEAVEPDDPSALAERLLAVLADTRGWDDRVAAGRAWVEERFSWERLGAQTARAYERLAGVRR